MSDSTTYLSFLIRLWREPSTEQPDSLSDWCGEIEHIQTGQRWKFTMLDELLDFLRQQAESLDRCSQPPAR